MTKSLPLLLLVLAGGEIARPEERSLAAQKDQPVIKVAIAIRELSDLPRELGNRNADAHFFVTVENTSSTPLLIKSQDDISTALTFEVTDRDGKSTVVRQTPMDGSHRQHSWRLRPGQPVVCEIRYMYPMWASFPFPRNPLRVDERRKVTIRAVFEEAPFADAEKQGYWVGKAVSEPCEVDLVDDAIRPGPEEMEMVCDSKTVFGPVKVRLQNGGTHEDQTLVEFTVTSKGKKLAIPKSQLTEIKQPMGDTVWIDLEPDQHGDTVLYVSFVLGKPVTETGEWNYPRMYFLFKDGAFLKRTIVERRPDISERHLHR